MSILRFPPRLRALATPDTAAIGEQARIGLIIDRLEGTWRDPAALHRALAAIGVPVPYTACEALSYARARIVCYPAMEDHLNYRATLGGVIEGLDVALLRTISLDVDNPPITQPEDIA